MKLQDENISTPVYLKTDKGMPWPKDKLFYILSSDGLFLCRNHEWFRSCAPAKHGPCELEAQEAFAHINYPQVPKLLVEKALSFFRLIFEDKHWESALIIVWNRNTNKMELVCPDQKASSASVKYEIPKLPQHLALIGDIHSHCDFSPEPSLTDKDDEYARPGLHIIAGYIHRKKPEFKCVAVVDGCRFIIGNHAEVLDEPEVIDKKSVPKEWVDKVVPLYKNYGWDNSDSMYGGSYGGSYDDYKQRGPDGEDEKVIKKVLAEYMEKHERPEAYNVRQKLFTATKIASYTWCEKRADEFLIEWDKAHEATQSSTQTATGR